MGALAHANAHALEAQIAGASEEVERAGNRLDQLLGILGHERALVHGDDLVCVELGVHAQAHAAVLLDAGKLNLVAIAPVGAHLDDLAHVLLRPVCVKLADALEGVDDVLSLCLALGLDGDVGPGAAAADGRVGAF